MSDPITAGIAARASAAKEAGGVTGAALADALGVSERTVWRLLKGDTPWDTRHIALAADALGVTIAHLIGAEAERAAVAS